MNELNKCTMCPHECKVDRTKTFGRCKSTDKVKIGLYSMHNFEEPCISGKNGSGTVFFSNCNLNCIYCQNYEISQKGKGKEVTIEELSNIFIEEQSRGANNINLVTPTSYVLQIIEAIKLAKAKGLNIPIVYNTNGYEKVETIKLLKGYIDIYLPDLKYYKDDLAKQYSNVDNYFDIATKAINEMCNQVGKPKFDNNNIMQKGVIVRHLVLPNYIENSKNIIKWFKENLYGKALISVMAQYFPTYKAKQIEKLNRKLTKQEYKEIEDFLYSLGIKEGFIQELGENEEEYVPKWNV